VLVCKHHLDKQEVRERVTHRLVDQVDTGAQNVERLLLARVPGLVLLNRVECVLREDDRAVSVGLKVDTNVELLRCVVEVLDACRCAVDL
jgi:hypothetical protein